MSEDAAEGMTESDLPDITVDYSHLWAHVAAGDDIDSWAPGAAQRLWAGSGDPYSRMDVDLLATRLALLAEGAFATQCLGAFFLCPELSRGPKAVVRLNGMRYPAGTADEEIVQEILLPDEMQLLPPEVTHLAGSGLRRIRMRQRAYTDETRTISDYISYVVPFDEGAWILSVAFPDSRDADRWLPELDALTEGVQLQAVP